MQRFYPRRKEYGGLKMDEARPKLPWAAIQPSGLLGGRNDLHQRGRGVFWPDESTVSLNLPALVLLLLSPE